MKKGKPPKRFAVRAIFPSGVIATYKTTPSHREARKHMLDRETELRARFGITMFVGAIR